MADQEDIAAVIESALTEIGVHGNLNVKVDGKTANVAVGGHDADDVQVTVTVAPLAA